MPTFVSLSISAGAVTTAAQNRVFDQFLIWTTAPRDNTSGAFYLIDMKTMQIASDFNYAFTGKHVQVRLSSDIICPSFIAKLIQPSDCVVLLLLLLFLLSQVAFDVGMESHIYLTFQDSSKPTSLRAEVLSLSSQELNFIEIPANHSVSTIFGTVVADLISFFVDSCL